MSVNFCKLLQKAEIGPIYQKGNHLDASNYRPVSILPGIRVSGVRKQHSCERVLLRMIENINKHFSIQVLTCTMIYPMRLKLHKLSHV